MFIALVIVGQAVEGPPGRSAPLPLPRDELELRVFDVGQGDAILLRFGDNALLVDAGPDPETAREVLLPRLARLGVEGLDGLVLTHADADHIGGAADILRALPVATVWMASSSQDHPLLSVIEDAARRGGTWIEEPVDGQALGWHPAVSVQMNIATLSVASGDNNQSMVLHVRYGESDFLLTGDIERAAERALVEAVSSLEVDVLKVAHHGASTSSSPEFLAAVKPQVAVISAGLGNAFNHPRDDVLRRLRAAGAHVYRTDLAGDVVVRTDGHEITVALERS
ncbi:MAG: ComEC/Rec2 family competence protein [Chloroflexota bacterium]|nr:ComEC/Rec2 family competence protein [Chloroflexota bacterium]MDE2921182.1 ComEC/Rec2 family competence protein [Chloroflexota bacterium]